jgi:hypothetical protein
MVSTKGFATGGAACDERTRELYVRPAITAKANASKNAAANIHTFLRFA